MGYFRLLLSLIVMAGHAEALSIIAAQWAVVGFYMLSGYFATISINTKYKEQKLDFLLNRWVRIWPSYAIVFFTTTLILYFFWIDDINLGLPLRNNWLLQIALLYSHTPGSSKWIVPTTWVLPNMMLWWTVIALGAASSSARTWIWLLGAMIFTINGESIRTDWYYSPLFASLPFAVGSVAYWLKIKLINDNHIGKIAGSLSYHIFLWHYLVIALMPITPGWSLFFASIAPTLILSWLSLIFVERPISRYHSRLRIR